MVTASIMNSHVRDNLNALKTPAGGYNKVNIAADLSTTSTTFVDADATELALTFTTGGGDVMVFFSGSVRNTASVRNYFDVHESVAATRYGGDDGLMYTNVSNGAVATNASFAVRITGLSAASHTFKLQWKVASGTGVILAGAGTASEDIHPTFSAFEL